MKTKTANTVLVQCKIDQSAIKLYINGILHLAIKRGSLIGIQTWKSGMKQPKFYIEYTLQGGKILTGYDCVEKWKSILKALNDLNQYDLYPSDW